MANERLQEEEKYHFKNYLLEMPLSHANMRLKNAPKKLNFVIAKAIPKSYKLDCSCKYPCTFHIARHSKTASFSIKITLCEIKNIFLSKNHSKLGKMNSRF